MSKTGILFIDAFFFINTLVFVVPVALLFIQKKFSSEPLIFLLVICLLHLGENIFLSAAQPTLKSGYSVQNIFSAIEFLVLLQVCRLGMTQPLREGVNIFSIVFLASITTYYILKGTGEQNLALAVMQDLIILVGSSILLASVVTTDELVIFSNPLFWLGCGSFFYFFIAFIVGALSLGNQCLDDSSLMLHIATLARFALYALAVLFFEKKTTEGEGAD